MTPMPPRGDSKIAVGSIEITPAPGSRRVAVYPGSFDPPHNGHLDVIQRCLSIFDEVLIAVLRNEEKKPLFSIDERREMFEEILGHDRRVRVESFSGAGRLHGQGGRGAHRARPARALGLRLRVPDGLDEPALNPRVETLFMMPKEEYSYLSSRLAKEAFCSAAIFRGWCRRRCCAACTRRCRIAGVNDWRPDVTIGP